MFYEQNKWIIELIFKQFLSSRPGERKPSVVLLQFIQSYVNGYVSGYVSGYVRSFIEVLMWTYLPCPTNAELIWTQYYGVHIEHSYELAANGRLWLSFIGWNAGRTVRHFEMLQWYIMVECVKPFISLLFGFFFGPLRLRGAGEWRISIGDCSKECTKMSRHWSLADLVAHWPRLAWPLAYLLVCLSVHRDCIAG